MNIARGRSFVLPAFVAVLLVGPLVGPAAAEQRPNPPQELGIEGWGPNGADALPCSAGQDRPSVGTRTPRLRTRVSDADGGFLSADFVVRRAGTVVAELTAQDVPSGSFAQVTVPTDVLVEGGVHRWSVRARDDQRRSERVGGCEFRVDTVSPNAPAVSSTDYPSSGFHGGPGRAGVFQFSPNGNTGANGSMDVVRYAWSLEGIRGEVAVTQADGVVTVPITPTSSGPNTLSVQAFDKAGNSATQTYTFMVAQPSRPVAVWNLDETGGTTAADSSGNGHALTLTDATFGIGYANNGQLNSTSSFSATNEKLLDTSRAFTVSAWVKLDNTDGTYTVVSQDGAAASGFALQYSRDVHRWLFGAASSAAAPQVGEWTHLVGTYESSTHTMSLYVNGKLGGTADATLYDTTGPFVVGAAKRAGARTEQLPGTIDHVQVWDRALIAAEVAKLSNSLVVPRAHYSTDELEGTTTKDEVSGRHGTLTGGVSWAHTPLDPDDPNQILTSKDKWLRFDESRTGRLTGPRPPNLRTDLSFTVSAWVRPRAFGDTAETVLSLGAGSPFTLGYRPEDHRWYFQVAETPSGGAAQVLSDHTAELNSWVHLAATFDATTGTIRLYVSGTEQAATAGPGLRTFNGAGDLLVGPGLAGVVDDVRVYSGALSAQDVMVLRLGTMHF